MQEKNLNTIWDVPAYLPAIQPDLTDAMIAEAEAKIGYKLPKEYIDLLRIQNGGYIRYTIVQSREIWGIGPLRFSITEFDLSENELSFETNGLFPFDGDGHWFMCFDYRENEDEPQITLVDIESDDEMPIADSFKEYLDMMILETEGLYVIETDSGIEEMVAKISIILGVEFEDMGSNGNGYPDYRSKYKEGWFWISPNRVLKGFVRENDPRYDELKSKMVGTGFRYPEISESALILYVPDEKVGAMLFNELTNNSLRIQPLSELIP